MLARQRVVVGSLLSVIAFFAVLGAAFHSPLPPAIGPDPSWMVGLGEAARDHFAFGRDIIYTWGPLGYLDVPGVVPNTYAAKTLFALSIACASGLLVLLRARSEGLLWQRFAFVLGALIILPFANPLYLVGEGDVQVSLLFALCFTFPALSQRKPLPLLALSLGLAGGFVSLIKFSLYLFVLIVGLGTFVVRALEHRKSPELCRADIESAFLYLVGFAAASAGIYYWVTYGLCYEIFLAVLGVAGAVFWGARCSGKGSFFTVPIPTAAYVAVAIVCSAVVAASAPYREFVYYSLQVAAGYSSAVGREAQSYVLAIGLLLLAIGVLLALREAAALGAARLFVVLAILVLAFKQAFVRQDPAHTIPYFVVASFVGCILLLCATEFRSRVCAALLIVLSLPPLPAFANYGQYDVPIVKFPAAVADGLTRAFRTTFGWQESFEMLAANYRLGLMPDVLAPRIRQQLGNAPVDLIGTETNIVFANGLAWKPRPAFHAPYSIFTPSLDALNRDSIRSGNTGRELLTYGSVDNKYPLGDEPMASRELICNYASDQSFAPRIVTQGGTALAILRRVPGRCAPAVLSESGTIGWNQLLRVRTPPGRIAFLFIDFRYSLLGKAFKTLYQIAPVRISIRYQSGSVGSYRVVPELLADGLLVNPIPRNMQEVRTLFAGLNADPVVAVAFTTRKAWLFSPTMTYTLRQVPYRAVAP